MHVFRVQTKSQFSMLVCWLSSRRRRNRRRSRRDTDMQMHTYSDRIRQKENENGKRGRVLAGGANKAHLTPASQHAISPPLHSVNLPICHCHFAVQPRTPQFGATWTWKLLTTAVQCGRSVVGAPADAQVWTLEPCGNWTWTLTNTAADLFMIEPNGPKRFLLMKPSRKKIAASSRHTHNPHTTSNASLSTCLPPPSVDRFLIFRCPFRTSNSCFAGASTVRPKLVVVALQT